MKTTRPTALLQSALTVALLGLATAPASAQTSTDLLRFSTYVYYSWYPIYTQPVYGDLVGHGLNGRSFNGKVLDDRYVASVSLDSVILPAGMTKDLVLVGTEFSAAKGSDKEKDNSKSGNKVNKVSKANKTNALPSTGLIFSGALDDGDEVLLRVDGVEAGLSGGTEVLRYAVFYAAEGGWAPLCGLDGAGKPVLAIPLSGAWDYRQGVPGGGDFLPGDDKFTFACEGYVLSKCVDMGYPPWAQGKLCDTDGKHCTTTTLAPWHQACTRLMRADYCGDGVSWTENGTLVAAHDGIGIRLDKNDWSLEAEWDEYGARCAVRDRIPTGVAPTCMAALETADCGSGEHLAGDTLLMSEVP